MGGPRRCEVCRRPRGIATAWRGRDSEVSLLAMGYAVTTLVATKISGLSCTTLAATTSQILRVASHLVTILLEILSDVRSAARNSRAKRSARIEMRVLSATAF